MNPSSYSSATFFPSDGSSTDARLMVFVDGENLSIRFKELIKNNPIPQHVNQMENVFVWSKYFNRMFVENYTLIRRYYYTSVVGDSNKIEEIEDKLRQNEIESPRVFKKSKKMKAKMVDISLATDMLTHAFRDNYDVALLIAGDEDYVPLIKAVQMEGKRVFGWFIDSGIGRKIKMTFDHYEDITQFLLNEIRYI